MLRYVVIGFQTKYKEGLVQVRVCTAVVTMIPFSLRQGKETKFVTRDLEPWDIAYWLQL